MNPYSFGEYVATEWQAFFEALQQLPVTTKVAAPTTDDAFALIEVCKQAVTMGVLERVPPVVIEEGLEVGQVRIVLDEGEADDDEPAVVEDETPPASALIVPDRELIVIDDLPDARRIVG